MSLTIDYFIPNAPGTGGIGTEEFPWGAGHFVTLLVNGSQVAPLASPAFSGVPTAPTASAGTSTTQLATCAFATAAANAVKARSTHTGTQLAATISDFDAAVTASTAGAKAHTQNSDTKLADGTGNEVTAAALRAHLDNASVHRTINDSGTGATDLLSAQKILALLGDKMDADAEFAAEDITGLGALAVLDSVGTSQIDNASVTAAKVAGGETSPAARKVWGVSGAGAIGFHDTTSLLKLTSIPTSGYGKIELDGNGELHIPLGTASNRAASGADARFPTADEKAALAGTSGSPSASNKFVTAAGLLSAELALATLRLTNSSELTIASGVVTVTQSHHTIDTEGNASSDDLTTINGASANQILYLRLENASRQVTLKHGTGNIQCSRGADIVLSSTTTWVILLWTGSAWLAGYNSAGPGIPAVESDTAPVLGGHLDPNGYGIAGTGGLELLTFTETGSAVNHVNITNGAAGTGPTIAAVGDDTNADLNLAGKGTGVPKIGGSAILTAAETGRALLAGRAGGQTLNGGTASGEKLTLSSTSHATKGGVALAAGEFLIVPELAAAPASPASGFGLIYVEAGTKILKHRDSTGVTSQLSGMPVFHRLQSIVTRAAGTFERIVGFGSGGTVSGGGFTSAAQELIVAPYVPTRNLTLDQINFFVNTTAIAGSTAKVVVYAANTSTNEPAALLYQTSAISTATTGDKSEAVAWSLNKDTLYWVGMIFSNHSGVQLDAVSADSLFGLGLPGSTAGVQDIYARRTGQNIAAVPDPFGTVAWHGATVGFFPRINARLA